MALQLPQQKMLHYLLLPTSDVHRNLDPMAAALHLVASTAKTEKGSKQRSRGDDHHVNGFICGHLEI
jgi:hypothetical protein